MKKDKVLEAVDRALKMALDHLAGNRDVTLSDYTDSQVERFAETLEEMKASLVNPNGNWVSEEYMAYGVVDGWPAESELGKLICKAANAYHSLKASASAD